MRRNSYQPLALVALLGMLLGSFAFPPSATAKVFLYAITLNGDLIKYDPDMDQATTVISNVDPRYINRRNADKDLGGPSRVLDVARGKIVSFINEDPGLVLLDLSSRRATEIDVGLRGTESWLENLVYLRKASRFYVFWLRRPTPTAQYEPVFTAVDLAGQVLGNEPSPIGLVRGSSIVNPDGRTFYALNQPNVLQRVDGQTLTVLENYQLGAFYRPEVLWKGIADVRNERALLSEIEGTRPDRLAPTTILTVDLATQTASARISTGLGSSSVRLLPGGRTIVLQEAWKSNAQAGTGRLHFYDVATGNKLGMVSFRADEGAVPLGFHPDGRRLFIRVWNADPTTGDRIPHLVIVDVVARTVVRDRPFPDIGLAVDFVDEP